MNKSSPISKNKMNFRINILSNFIFQILFVLHLISCSEKKRGEHFRVKEKSISQISTDYDTLIFRIKFKGDVEAFEELYYDFLDSSIDYRTDSLMRYSSIMAEKYNHSDAFIIYFDAFLMKNNIYFDGFENLDLSSLSIKNKTKAKNQIDKMLKNKIINHSEYENIKW